MHNIDLQPSIAETKIATVTGSLSRPIINQPWPTLTSSKSLAQGIPALIIAALAGFGHPAATLRPGYDAPDLSISHTWVLRKYVNQAESEQADWDNIVLNDIEQDSPPFVSKAYLALRARGFKRINNPRHKT